MIASAFESVRREARREPLRLMLTAVGVAVGAATVVMLAAILAGATHALSYASQEASGADVTRVDSRRAPPGEHRPSPGLSPRDVRALALHEGMDESELVATWTVRHRDGAAGASRMKIGVHGGGARYAALARLELLHGRWPTPGERGERVCVVGHEVFESLLGGRWVPGASLVLDDATRLRVVGVLAPKPPLGGGDGDGTWRVDRQIVVSDETFRRTVQPVGPFDSIAFQSRSRGDSARDPKAVARELLPLLRSLHRGVEDFELSALARGEELDGLITFALAVILLGAGLVSTVVGAVNVMNGALVVVQERTREYGVRRALGISAQRLRREVLAETMLVTAMASAAGAAMGSTAAWVVARVMTRWVTPWPFEPSLTATTAGVLLGVGAGALAGWLPAKRAGELSVVTCLRAQ